MPVLRTNWKRVICQIPVRNEPMKIYVMDQFDESNSELEERALTGSDDLAEGSQTSVDGVQEEVVGKWACSPTR